MTTPSPLGRYATTQKQYDARLIKVLERAALDIQKRVEKLQFTPGIASTVRRSQLNLVLGQIRAVQHDMWTRGVTSTVVRGQKAAAEAAVRAAEDLDRVMYAALPESVADAIRGSVRATAQAGIDAAYSRVPRELSQRVYKDFALSGGHVEAIVQSGIVQGLSAKELAADVYHYISPTVPGGASYAAQRLARTEINNAFHQQQIAGGQRPGVSAVKWNLSGSHKRPDECNQFATEDNGLGAGCFKPASVPGKPHPQCLCYMTYVLDSAEKFRSDLQRGKYDNELDARIKRNLELLGQRPVKAVATKAATATKSAPVKAVKAAPAKAVKAVQPPKVKPLTPRPKPKDLDFDIPPPISSSVDNRIKHASELLSNGKTQSQTMLEIAKSYQISNTDALKLVVQAQRGNLTARVVTNSSPLGDLMSRVHIPGANGDLIKSTLREQADLVPKVSERFRGVRLGTDNDFSGPGVVGVYSPLTERAVLHEKVFTSKYAKVFEKEVRTGFATPCGHNHTAPQSVFSHEFGHHVHKFIDEAPRSERFAFWNNVQRELDMTPRPHNGSVAFDDINGWIGANKQLIHGKVSRYGTTNSFELLAEIWQEYSTMGSRARPHIRNIGRMMQEMAERNVT